MARISRRSTSRLLAAVTGFACLSTVSAGDVTWIGTGSAVFNQAANWNPAQIPSGTDVAIFNNNLSPGTVAFTGPASLAELSFRNTSGSLTLDFGLNAVTVANRYAVGTAAGETNNILFSNGTFTHTGTFAIGASGSIGNTVTVSGLTTNLISTTTGTAVLGPAGSNDNLLQVRNGASYVLQSNIVIGSATSTGNHLRVQDARFAITGGNRGININQGTLTVDNAYLDAGLLTAGTFNSVTSVTTIAFDAYINFNSGTLLARRWSIINNRQFVVGNGGSIPATLAMHSSGPTCNFANGVQLNSNGRIIGSGTITGNVTAMPGAKVNPSSLGVASITSDDLNYGTLGVVGSWDNTNIELTLDLGDFPTKLAGTVTPPFTPPNNALNVTGAFTHGGSVNVDLYDYVPPQDQDYSIRVLNFTSEAGVNTATQVNFVHGAPLSYQWQSDGLYVTAAQAIVPSTSWTFDGAGTWSDGSKWASGSPNGLDSIVAFSNILSSGPATVTLDAPVTVGKITISGSNAYVIDGSSLLTFDVDKIGTARIQATSGSGAHIINSPIAASDNMCINVGSTTLLTTNGTITVSGKELRKIGPGTLAVGKVIAGTLALTDGITKLKGAQNAAGVLEAEGFAITSNAILDVGNAGVVVNPASGDLAPDIRAALITGHRLGLWNGFGIASSHAAANPGFGVGYARGSEMGVSTVFESISIDSNTVVLRETYNGDSNLDGKVNTVDFNYLAGGFGSGSPGWVNGDYDYDNDVDSIDFNALAANYGKVLPPAAPGLGSVVPEPAALSVVALAGLLVRRRR